MKLLDASEFKNGCTRNHAFAHSDALGVSEPNQAPDSIFCSCLYTGS